MQLVFREKIYSDYSLQVLNADGSPFDLSGYDVKFIFEGNEKSAEIINPTEGEITYKFKTPELDKVGIYKGYFVLEKNGIKKISIPDTGYITIKVVDDYIN